MTRLLLVMALALSSLLLMGTGAALAWGQSYAMPDDPRAASLDHCQGAPCLLGITPGTTAWPQSSESYAALRFSDFTPKRLTVELAPGGTAEMYRSVNQIAIGPIYITLKQPLAVGWLLARYGQPCGITFYRYQSLMTIRYPFLLANALLEGDRLHSRLPVVSITYADPAMRSEIQTDLCVDNVTDGARNRQWHGFAPVWVYMKWD
jgi:hypothetical protein